MRALEEAQQYHSGQVLETMHQDPLGFGDNKVLPLPGTTLGTR